MFKNRDGLTQPIKQFIDNIDQIRRNKERKKHLNIRLTRNIVIIIEVNSVKDIKAIK